MPSEAGVGAFGVVIGAPGGQHDAGMVRAWCRDGNRVSFKSSSRRRPLKLSIKAFWVGFPGAI